MLYFNIYVNIRYVLKAPDQRRRKMKKQYDPLELEIILLAADVLTASDPGGMDPGTDDPLDGNHNPNGWT